MIWHPHTWAFWIAAVTGSGLYLAAAACAWDVALNWRPERSDPVQLRCERHAQMAALLGRWALCMLAGATLLGLIGITRVWHTLIPGAMCGTGVLQAMGAEGYQALIFWGITWIWLFAWQIRDGLDRDCPQGVLTDANARLLIAVLPFLCLALFHTWRAVMRIDGAPPVSCCAAVYDRVLADPAGVGMQTWQRSAALWSCLGGILLLPFLATAAARSRIPGGPVAALSLVWAITATLAIKQTWSSYYYEVLSHPCPWCLFLPEYHGAGFLIFGCLGAVLLETIALWAAGRIQCRHACLAGPAGRRQWQAVRRITAALIGFTLLTVGPALLWRYRTGTWLDGTP
ncbi:conserved membrane hypothetical protein [Desulfosarcina cetonica]|uniref:hypothetical protein n=1 Tax=Desulfosarcina cetonica TaxID=90730 RepID=UPI0006D0AE60|nr:hypothetical protein [Desulfosarcina cetonica]VTR69659.1 conserved membrane hypothetical protein [Desulfosarcina cetonica]